MRNSFLRLVSGVAIAAVMLCTAQISSAQRVGPDTIALFPKNVGEFAYANLKQARSQKWFAQLQQQMLPERFRQFETFLASAGVDPNSQVEELAWGLVAEGVTAKTEGTGSSAVPTGEEVVGVALGNYNPETTEAYFKAQKLPTFKSHGLTMYAFGGGAGANDLYFLFLDVSTAAFGHRSELEKMLGVPIFCMIPNDYPELYETYAEGRMLNRNSDLGKQIAKLAGKLTGLEDEKGQKKRFAFFG